MELFNFAKKHKNVKVVTRQIPNEILPNAKLHDISINSFCADDQIYNESPELREKIARGNAILQIDKEFFLVIRGFKKFTGYEKYDEDEDSDFDYNLYLKEKPTANTLVYCMEKVNGKAGHISCFSYKDTDYIACGSKNVHMILRRNSIKSDLALYSNNKSHLIAKDIGMLVEKLPEKWFDYLKKNNLTGNIEFISAKNEHIVNYHNSEDTYAFLCYTPNSKENITINPVDSRENAKSFGLNVAQMHSINYSELDEYILNLRDQENSEGIVAYMVNPDTKETIGLVKLKSKWYVLIRAIREKIKRWNIDKIPKRIDEIREWLKLSDKEVEYWKKTGLLFAKYLYLRLEEKKIVDSNIFDKYATLWTNFSKDIQDPDELQKIENVKIINHPLIVFCSACQGLGKSTLARVVSYLLKGIWINQDECGGIAKKFHTKIHSSINLNTQVIVDKCLHTVKHRKSFVDQFPSQSMIFISLTNPDKDVLRKVAYQRIEKRGMNHKSFQSNNPDKEKIINMFINMHKPVTVEEFKEYEDFETRFHVYNLDVEGSILDNVQSTLKFLGKDFSKEEVNAAIQKSLKDEKSINTNKKYWRASILDKDTSYWKETISWALGEYKHNDYEKNYKNHIYKRKNEPHVTMMYVKDDRDMNEEEEKMLATLLPMYKTEVDIEVTHIVFNSKCICMRVKDTIPTINKIPHITLSLSKFVEPYYANYMLEHMEKEEALEVEYSVKLKSIVN